MNQYLEIAATTFFVIASINMGWPFAVVVLGHTRRKAHAGAVFVAARCIRWQVAKELEGLDDVTRQRALDGMEKAGDNLDHLEKILNHATALKKDRLEGLSVQIERTET